MPFNASKCEMIAFNQSLKSVPKNKVVDVILKQVHEVKHLEVVPQPNLKFTTHIHNKISSANKVL